MSLFSRLAGVINAFFQIGGPGGAGWNDVGATAIEAKDPTNTTFVIVRGATPVAPNDLVTKGYADTLFKPIAVGLQFNGNNALPANTATEKFYVVTTTGPNATIGQVLWDNGTGAGTVTVLGAVTGNEIITTAALAGGTITFTAFQNYVWNGAAWVSLATAATPGAVQAILFTIAAATASSVTSLPSGATILRASLNVTAGYTVGATISIGTAAAPAAFQATTDND